MGALPCALAVSLLLLKSFLVHPFEERLQFRIAHAAGFDLRTKWRENLIERRRATGNGKSLLDKLLEEARDVLAFFGGDLFE